MVGFIRMQIRTRSVSRNVSPESTRKRSITNSEWKIRKHGPSRGRPSYRGSRSIRRNRCTNTPVTRITTISSISWQERVHAKREGKQNEKCSRHFVVGSHGQACVSPSCLRSRIRCKETGQIARDRDEDGVDQSSCLDPHRRQETGRNRRRMDDRGRHSKHTTATRFHERFFESRDGGHRRRLSV